MRVNGEANNCVVVTAKGASFGILLSDDGHQEKLEDIKNQMEKVSITAYFFYYNFGVPVIKIDCGHQSKRGGVVAEIASITPAERLRNWRQNICRDIGGRETYRRRLRPRCRRGVILLGIIVASHIMGLFYERDEKCVHGSWHPVEMAWARVK